MSAKGRRSSRGSILCFLSLIGILLLAVAPLFADEERQEGMQVSSRGDPPSEEGEEPSRHPALAPFIYNAKGRRDPFIPLLTKGDETTPSLSSLVLTGLIWNRNEKLAILEDPTGKGYPMRIGDRLGSATLVDIRDDSVVFKVVFYGEVHMHTLKLIRKEEL